MSKPKTFDHIAQREAGLHRRLTAGQMGMIGIGGATDVGLFPGAGGDSRQWRVGLGVPVGASGKALASYGHRKTEIAGGGDEARSSQWAVGYEHWLSKRTGLYATYAAAGNSDAAEAAGALATSTGDATRGGDGYQRGFNLGVRHFF